MPMADTLLSTWPQGCSAGLRVQTGDDLVFLQTLFVARRWAEVSRVPGWSDAQRRTFLHAQEQLQRQHYEKHYASADFLIIEQAGTPIGRLCVHHTPEDVRVVDIALLPAWHGKGIGTDLLQWVLSQADSAHRSCSLSVEQGSPARRLYHRLGFSACGDAGIYTQMTRPARPVLE